MTKWIHPPERGGAREHDQFDPVTEGARYQLSRELSLELWECAVAEATDSAGRSNKQEAQRRFHELAARMTARGDRVRPDVGRLTRGDAGPERSRLRAGSAELRRGSSPGRETLVDSEARRWARDAGISDIASKDNDHVVAQHELFAGDVAPRAVSWRSPHRLDHATRLESSLGERLSRLFQFDITKIEVVPESSIAVGSTKAVTKEGKVHFRAGAYQPGTPEGDWLIAHELAHVVQLFGGRGERAGSRKELEVEADRAASLAAMGKLAPIALRADAAAAYAFSEGEDHAEPLDTNDDAKADDERDAKADDERDAKPGDDHGDKQDPKPAPDKAHADASAPAEQPADDPDAHDDVIDPGELAAASAPVPAEAGGDPGAPGGGAAPAKPQKEPPSVAGGKPEVGLAQLQGVRPDKLGPVFGQLHSAASADVAKTRAEQQANPPKQMSTGGPATAKSAKAKDGAPIAEGDSNAAKKELPDHPVKAEVPGGEADKQAKQGQAAQEQKTAGQVITETAQSIASWFTSWLGGGAPADKNTVTMSETETRQMSGSLDNLPTTASDISTDTGPPPEIKMKGEAKSSADKDRADLETKTAQLETQGRADSRAPMGEDNIETTVATEELTAQAVPGGAQPDAALPTVADAAATEEAGFIAQEQSGAEIDAALAKASTDVGTERGKHTDEEARARADSDKQIRELKDTADADQEAARIAAKGEVEQTRGEWQGEIDKKGADARKQADKKVTEGMAQVEAEETKANTEARQHVDEGKRKADEEKQKGEKEAADAKDKGKEQSSGFFGWLSSKAKAFFDGIKKAVSAAIDACRKAVKAVIDAAKKLAMAAIELARKAIVAAIKLVGEALIAISNVLLAAFPELKAKFQNAIRKAVDKAVDAVNKLAEGLKKAVQQALDMLGAALDKALQLLEKGINLVIDAANAVVQGAIKAAQAVVEMLGQWAKLIKDIASGPGAWIKNLGAAILDGIKNHLWSAFKTAVVEWFKAKVFELLGVGGIILQLLLEGGLTRENIIQMALDALIVAIPAALIMILIEKLVAMIVPAAGAIIAIIEGLQAAWGTISRIIAAFAAFMAFLLAVKAGGAGPLFATVLASAAVVVLDFVANWLLKKLMSAARKVGAKLKSMAEKFKAKRKAKRDAKAPKKHHDDRDGAGNKKKKDDDKKNQSKEDKKKQETEKRLEKAQRELPPKIKSLLAKKPSKLRVRAQFALWKLTYKLSRMELIGSGREVRIEAQVNPPVNLGPAGRAWELEWSDVVKVFDRVAGEYVGHAEYPATGTDVDYRTRTSGSEASLRQQGKYVSGTHDDGSDSSFGVHEKNKGFPGYLHNKVLEVRQTGADTGRMYPAINKDLQGVDPKALGAYLQAKFRGDKKLPPLGGAESVADELFGLWSFEAGHPRDRVVPPGGGKADYVPQFGQRRDYAYAMMNADLMASGKMNVNDAIMNHPAQGHGAQAGARAVTQADVQGTAPIPTDEKGKKAYEARKQRELELIKRWLMARTEGPNAKLWDQPPSVEALETFVRAQLREFRAQHGGG
jgi:hypothetical protein